MPKEKNSAASAIWPAVRAARGSSIIVPMGNRSVHPLASATSLSTPAASSMTSSSSWIEPTRGIMISACGSPPMRWRKQAASAIART